jgi:serine/threonine protein kinase
MSPKIICDASNNYNAPQFTDEETKKIVSIATPLIEKAKADGNFYKQTHKKDFLLFKGQKTHSLALPNGTFVMFVKNPKDPSKKLEEGAHKDMDSSALYVLDENKTIIEFPKTARLRFKNTSQALSDVVAKEIDYYIALDGHPNIVKTINSMSYEKSVGTQKIFKNVLFLELYQMNLDEFLKSHDFLKTKDLDRTNLILSILKQQLQAIYFVHGKKLVHNDIKNNNFLINPPHVVLTDFGHTHPFEQINQTKQHGCYPYLSPEKCLQLKIISSSDKLQIQTHLDHKIDLWALGVCLFCMKNGTKYFPTPSYYIKMVYDTLNQFTTLQTLNAENPSNKHTISHANNSPVPVEKSLEKIEQLKNQLFTKTQQFSSSVDSSTKVSDFFQALKRTDPDVKILTQCQEVEGAFILLVNEMVNASKAHPEILQQPQLREAYIVAREAYNSILKTNNLLIRRYWETIPDAKMPSKDSDPVNYLIYKLLQPDASKRIDALEALQVIEDFQLNQMVSATTSSSSSSENTRKRSFIDTEELDNTQ